MASAALTRMKQRIRENPRLASLDEDGELDVVAARQTQESAAGPVPDDVDIVACEMAGVAAQWVTAPGANPDRRILYLHGGGYCIGSLRSHARLQADVSRASGAVVLGIDYRLAPEHRFPAALDDALMAYRWMRANGPDGPSAAAASFIVGDPAGGGLTLATLLATRDAGDAMPSGAITMSAHTDHAYTGDSWVSRADLDPMLTQAEAAATSRAYLGDEDPRNPLASPLYGDFAGLPPLLMQVGDHEGLLDDTVRVAERAEAVGVDVTLEVIPEAFHVFQWVAALVPEAQAAVDRIGEFVRRHT